MKQTQQQIEKLKSLRESLDWAIDLAENQLPELKSALLEIKDKVSNITIDLSPVAKEETLLNLAQSVKSIADIQQILSSIYEYAGSVGAVMPESKNVENLLPTLKTIVVDRTGTNGVQSISFLDDSSITEINMDGISGIANTSLNSLCSNLRYVKKITISKPLDVSFAKTANSMFQNCSSVTEIDITGLKNFGNVTSISNLLVGCTSIKKFTMRGVDTHSVVDWKGFYISANTYPEFFDIRDCSWESVNMQPVQPFVFYCESLVGGESYEDVVANDSKIFVGLNINYNTYNWALPGNIGHASIRAMINGLADRTGQEPLTLTLSSHFSLTDLTEEDIAIATNKNWTLA
jgi:surface protein